MDVPNLSWGQIFLSGRGKNELASQAVWYDIPMQIDVTLPPDWAPEEYALLDSGAGYKLERFGGVTLARPDPQAIWPRQLVPATWEAADATFSRDAGADEATGHGTHWVARRDLPEAWPVHWRDLTLLARLTPFKHTGIFPEQAAHWDWLAERIQAAGGREVRMLNLFGYTGAATLAAARAGALVTHVDAAPKVLEWARENQGQSGLGAAPIRWLVDDAQKFVRREARRDAHYDLIMLDPPAFGRGAKGEVWKFETSLPSLLLDCRAILTPRPLGIVITGYSIRASALLLRNLLATMMAGHRVPGAITTGELALAESGVGRLLSTAIYARWSADR
jgi:23S rRNA (cytosine1962-C5)-methyltransferase